MEPRKKVVSPNILKISEVFEKKEKMVLEKPKTGENVKKIKNRFESMMEDTSTRQKKFEMRKRKRKAPIFSEEKTTQRNTLYEWPGVTGGSDRKQKQKLNTDLIKKSDSTTIKKGSSSSCSSSIGDRSAGQRSKSVGDDVQAGKVSTTCRKVTDVLTKSRQRKGSANEKCLNLRNKNSNSENVLQKEGVLSEKVKIWNSFFKGPDLFQNEQKTEKCGLKIQKRQFRPEKVVGTSTEEETQSKCKKLSKDRFFKGGQFG